MTDIEVIETTDTGEKEMIDTEAKGTRESGISTIQPNTRDPLSAKSSRRSRLIMRNIDLVLAVESLRSIAHRMWPLHQRFFLGRFFYKNISRSVNIMGW